MKQGVRLCLLLPMVTIVAALCACGEKISPGNAGEDAIKSVQAPMATAVITEEPFFYEAVATINAYTTSTISGKLMGAVLAIHVREGDPIKKGDILAVLDARQVDAQLDGARAALREAQRSEASAVSAIDAAKAAAELAETTFQRSRRLVAENTISRQAFEEAQSRHLQARAALTQSEALLDAAQSRIQQAEAAVREAIVAKKDATLEAPYNGRVTARMIDEGDLVSPGTPMFTIEQEGLFCAELVLPERHIAAVTGDLKVDVNVPALGKDRWTGKVCEIVPLADIQSRSFEVKIALPEGPDYKSGMFARVYIPLGGADILAVPQTAIITQGQLKGVYIVDDEQIARLRLIKTGQSLGERVEIISGLDAGQIYLTAIPPVLKAGVRVEGVR